MERTFRTHCINGKFIIAEQAVTRWGSVNRQTAWDRARAQANPVVFVDTEGNERELGDCFDAETWVRTMYTGHISHELSMTDGHYAPEGLDRWLHWFKLNPTTAGIDATPETLAALDRWLATA